MEAHWYCGLLQSVRDCELHTFQCCCKIYKPHSTSISKTLHLDQLVGSPDGHPGSQGGQMLPGGRTLRSPAVVVERVHRALRHMS